MTSSIKSSIIQWKIITIFVILLVLMVSGQHQQSSNKKRKQNKNQQLCNKKEFETNFDKLLVVTSPNRNFPENQAQLKQFCSENNELATQLNQYKNQCLKETLKNFVSIIIYSMKASMKRICSRRNSPQVLALIDASNCINRNKVPINKCMDKGSDNFAAIKFINSNKMPYICCQFVEMLQCFSDVMNRNGCQDKLPILLENISSVVGNFLDSTCGEYNVDTDKCEQMKSLPKNVTASSKHFVTNLVDIFNSV